MFSQFEAFSASCNALTVFLIGVWYCMIVITGEIWCWKIVWGHGGIWNDPITISGMYRRQCVNVKNVQGTELPCRYEKSFLRLYYEKCGTRGFSLFTLCFYRPFVVISDMWHLKTREARTSVPQNLLIAMKGTSQCKVHCEKLWFRGLCMVLVNRYGTFKFNFILDSLEHRELILTQAFFFTL